MKTPLPKLLARLVLTLAVVSAAYYAGRQGWLGDTGSKLAGLPVIKPPAPKTATGQPAEAGPAKKLTLEEAKAKFLDMLAGKTPPGMKANFNQNAYIRSLAALVDPKDIPALMAALGDAQASYMKDYIFVALLEELTQTDPGTALSLVANIQEPYLRQMQTSQILNFMAAHDPKAALQAIADMPQGSVPPNIYSSIMQTWAASNPAEAVAYLASLPPGPQRNQALAGVASGLAKTDPKAALEWAEGLPAADAGAMRTVLATIAQANPQLAADNLDKVTNAAQRSSLIATIIDDANMRGTYIGNSPEAELGWLGKVATGTAYQNDVSMLFASLTSASGNSRAPNYTEAVSLLGTLTDTATRKAAITSMASGWSQADPKAAVTWAISLPKEDSSAANAAYGTIMTAWAKSSPAAVLDFAENTPRAATSVNLAGAIGTALGESDPQAAFTFIQSLPDGQAKNNAVVTAMTNIAESDLAGAISYATQMPAGAAQAVAFGGIFNTAAKENPAHAATLLDSLPPGPAQTNAATLVATDWVNSDSSTFLDWVNGLPPSDIRDAAIAQLDASDQAVKHPSMAFTQANSIANPDLRAAQVEMLITTWGIKDPQAALTAVKTADIPDAQKNALIQSLSKYVPSGN